MYRSEPIETKKGHFYYSLLLLYNTFIASKIANIPCIYIYISVKWFIHYNLYVKLRQKKAKRKRMILLVKNSYTVIRMQASLTSKSKTEAEVYRFQNFKTETFKKINNLKPLFSLFQIRYLASGTSLQEIVFSVHECVCAHHWEFIACHVTCMTDWLWA